MRQPIEKPPLREPWKSAYLHVSLAMQIALEEGEDALAAELAEIRSRMGETLEGEE